MKAGKRWAVVLAGGRGTRLAPLTTVDGETIPKQYWALAGGPSMLRCAIARATRFAGIGRVLVVVMADQRRYWELELQDLPPGDLMAQPADRGTAAGLLLALAEVLRREPQATVAFVPADHYVEEEGAIAAALDLAATAVSSAHPIALVGIRPEEADPDLGWILTGDLAGPGARQVERFHEKPSVAEASALLAGGALVNTFLFVACAPGLWQLGEILLPDVALPLAAAGGPSAQIYRDLPARDFSRDLLQACPERMVAVDAGPCGWSDLGTPSRVAQCLRRMEGSPSASYQGEVTRDLRHQLASRAGDALGLTMTAGLFSGQIGGSWALARTVASAG